jgi:hypothetical protein
LRFGISLNSIVPPRSSKTFQPCNETFEDFGFSVQRAASYWMLYSNTG